MPRLSVNLVAKLSDPKVIVDRLSKIFKISLYFEVPVSGILELKFEISFHHEILVPRLPMKPKNFLLS